MDHLRKTNITVRDDTFVVVGLGDWDLTKPFVIMISSAWPMVSRGVTVNGFLVITSTTFIQMYLPTGAVIAMFIPPIFDNFLLSVCAKKQRRFFIVDSAASRLISLFVFTNAK